MLLTVDGGDDATQVHVDRRSEEDGGEKDEDRLDGVRRCGFEVVVTDCSGSIPHYFDCGSESVSA